MTNAKLSRRRNLARLSIFALALPSVITVAPAQTHTFDRLDVEIAVNAKAPLTVLDAENMRFTVERNATPRTPSRLCLRSHRSSW
ncbi:hypothetical protein SAMN04515648_0947 [Phyllobacterium sp. CL33Tsu]|nr:hypothetical protein SAMN04515648_0947 [Phyllobacterium sp. CL33Tsu]